MAALKLQQENQCAPDVPVAETVWKLPADMMLEIIARSDISTLFTFTVACKLVRRDILDLFFIRRVTQQGGVVPPRILVYLKTDEEEAEPPSTLSLVHPATPAVASFVDVCLSPFMSRFADDLLGDHYPAASRGGLVLFHRRNVSTELPNLCVYDIFTGHRTFLSDPPGIGSDRYFDICVLLTGADGIDCSFVLFVANIVEVHDDNYASTVQVHTATSMYGTWAPVVPINSNRGFLLQHWQGMHGNIVVLDGGFIHWLVYHYDGNYDEIFSYNVITMEQSTIQLPAHITNFKRRRVHLGSYYSDDGRKLLRVLGVDGFKISVWRQLSSGYWESEAKIIDTEEKLRPLDKDSGPGEPSLVVLRYFDEGGNTVLLHAYMCPSSTPTLPIVLDLETKEICVRQYPTLSSLVFEVDLPSRLRAMKIFS